MQHDDAVRLYSQLIRPGDLVFDVGANTGQRTDIFLELGADVVAIEPNPDCIAEMEARYKDRARVRLVQKACDSTVGVGALILGEQSTISTMSPAWIEKLKASGRFGHLRWREPIQVELTTLDHLINHYGLPAFCKIDVEGYERAVLQGLTRPIKALSFEFTPEVIVSALSCIDRLSALSIHNFNYSLGESGKLALAQWISDDEIKQVLITYPDQTVFGDVYARL